MLADELATLVDQRLRAFLLGGLIVPGTREGNFHRGGRAHITCAEEEGGVAGNDLCVGERTDVADLRLIRGELAGLDHLVQLHTGCDACEEAAFIDVRKRIVVVCKALGVCERTGCMAELDFREFLSRLNEVGLMTEAVRKDDLAAFVDELSSRIVALLTFRDVGAQDVLILRQTHFSAGRLCSIDEVEVVGGVFIMQEDEANFEVCGVGGLRCGLGRRLCGRLCSGFRGGLSCRRGCAGNKREDHRDDQHQGENLFHGFPPLYFVV